MIATALMLGALGQLGPLTPPMGVPNLPQAVWQPMPGAAAPIRAGGWRNPSSPGEQAAYRLGIGHGFSAGSGAGPGTQPGFQSGNPLTADQYRRAMMDQRRLNAFPSVFDRRAELAGEHP